MSESPASAQPPQTAQNSSEPIREVLTRLLSNAGLIPASERQLATSIRDLGLVAKDPVQFNDTAALRSIAVAAQSFERVTGKMLDLSPAQREEVAKYAAPSDSPLPKADDAPKAAAPQTPSDPIRDVLTKLVANLGQLPEAARELGTKIRQLDNEARDPVRLNQKSVQHEIAYAAQDFEKAAGKHLDFSQPQRDEITKLASSAPGLENERMVDLLRRTSQLDNSALVAQIRRNAAEIGHQTDQNIPKILQLIDTLENSVRLAARAPEARTGTPKGEAASKTEQAGAATSVNPSSNGAAIGQQSPRNGYDARRDRNGAAADQSPLVQTAVLRGGILDTLTSVFRGNGQPNNAPWDPQATPFGDRLAPFQAKVDARDQDRTIGRVEKSARTALDALDGFRSTEGAAVLNRVQTAARAEPGGMAGVLSEMREGGRFSDLRQAFNKALNDDKGFADAYDRAASALARYGEGREKVEQIIAKRPDAANLIAKFDQLDSQVGERAGKIPSRNDGKNMLDDISKTVVEIIQKATDAVRTAFTRNPSAGPSASPAA
jgi:hypothetical protein